VNPTVTCHFAALLLRIGGFFSTRGRPNHRGDRGTGGGVSTFLCASDHYFYRLYRCAGSFGTNHSSIPVTTYSTLCIRFFLHSLVYYQWRAYTRFLSSSSPRWVRGQFCRDGTSNVGLRGIPNGSGKRGPSDRAFVRAGVSRDLYGESSV